ncbi:transposable element Tcb1 transposase [Trichonephila clavipes]|nr:transposable element Tcb1 transposase [Trichonephila clavipes]
MRIVVALQFLGQCGFPFDRNDVINLDQTYLAINKAAQLLFTNRKPGIEWVRGFEKRWKEELESVRTIRCRLQQSGLSARRPLLGLPLTQNHRRLHRQWCDERRMWAAEWNEVIFTDESRICLQHHDGRIRVWRYR